VDGLWARRAVRLGVMRFCDAPSELFRRAIRMMRLASSVDSLRCLPSRLGRLGPLNCIEKGMFGKDMDELDCHKLL
jgi:hypothetical protein